MIAEGRFNRSWMCTDRNIVRWMSSSCYPCLGKLLANLFFEFCYQLIVFFSSFEPTANRLYWHQRSRQLGIYSKAFNINYYYYYY